MSRTTTTRIGLSTTDFRALSDEDLAAHIAIVGEKCRHRGHTPTARNWRDAKRHQARRLGRTQGYVHLGTLVREGDAVLVQVAVHVCGELSTPTYEGTAVEVMPDYIIVEGPSPYEPGRTVRTCLRNMVAVAA